MLRNSEIIGSRIRARDGIVGTISDVLFDHVQWRVRWMVVDTGSWLSGRHVLLPFAGLGERDAAQREVRVDLDRQQIESSPSWESSSLVSRQIEERTLAHYDWPSFLLGGYVPPAEPVHDGLSLGPDVHDPRLEHAIATSAEDDQHLRRASDVAGHYVDASDGNIGHIEDFLLDRHTGEVRYLVVDTRNWWPGRMVLISPDWVRDVDWVDCRMFVHVAREKVEGSPPYDLQTLPDRDYEARLYSHYGYPPYWDG